MPNVYYDPEKFGLTIVGEVEWSDGFYQFDTSVVWRRDDGTFYVADDSGCSCPSPFEGHGIEDLQKIERLQDLIDYFEARKKDSYRYRPGEEWAAQAVAEIDGEIGAVIGKYRELAAGGAS